MKKIFRFIIALFISSFMPIVLIGLYIGIEVAFLINGHWIIVWFMSFITVLTSIHIIGIAIDVFKELNSRDMAI